MLLKFKQLLSRGMGDVIILLSIYEKTILFIYKLDRSGTDQTSIKGPVKIAYNKFVSKLAKQEDTTSLALC